MGERTIHTPGAFCWVDLGTTDVEAATRFYTELLGWEAEPLAESVVMRLRGRRVAALRLWAPEGARPPGWNSYLSVVNAEATAARARALGGEVVAGGVVRDPVGAVFGLWEPHEHIGAELVNEPGAWCWNTLHVGALADVQPFYHELLGWLFEPGEHGATTIMLGAHRVGGVQEQPPERGIPPHWNVSFAVEDIADGHARALAAGASERVPPTDIGIGSFSVLEDPQGAEFALYAGLLDP